MSDFDALNSISTSDALDESYLTQLLHKMGYPTGKVSAFRRETLSGDSFGGGQIQRFHLTSEGDTSAPKSLILKETRPLPSQILDPEVVRREIDCYDHQLFNGLTNLIVPKAYHTISNPQVNQYWLWLEDFDQAFSVAWTPQRFAHVIRSLAELHALWWGREAELRPMTFLRHQAQAMYAGIWTERIKANSEAIDTHLQKQLIRQVFTPERCALLIRLSDSADLVYSHLDRLPQTLLHHDIWLPNVGIHHDKMVLIDWSYVGCGTSGSELSQMVAHLFALWGGGVDDEMLLQALYEGLTTDRQIPVSFETLLAGYELTFCLRPAHVLGGPILGNILAGRPAMSGSSDLEARLASAEATFTRIERGIKRL